jgi:vacuolar-type H+-ATPase subunit E/Vma4
MPYEQLIKSVEMCADEKIADIKGQANRDAVEIVNEAKGKDEKIKKRHMEAAKRAVEMEGGKTFAQIKKDLRMQLIQRRDEVYQKAISEAQKKFSSARDAANYPKMFKKLLEEVVSELEGEPIELHIDRRDETLCKKILSDLHLNCGIVTDITTAGGLEAATNDGRFVVFNTIESRFARAKVLLKPEIFAILYGGQGGM